MTAGRNFETMSERSPKITQRPIRGCQAFRSRGIAAHAATFAGAVALWFVAYVGVVSVAGWTDMVAANGLAGAKARLFAGSAAGVVMGSALAVAYARALGSPMLNLLLPSLFTAVVPGRVYALLAAPPDPLLVTSAVTAAAALAAPSGVAVLAVIAWYRVRFGSMAAGTDWEADHFPPGFRLAESANDDGSVDFENADYGLVSHDGSLVDSAYKHAFGVFGVFLVVAGILVGTEYLLGPNPAATVLFETPWFFLVLVGLAYVAWLNRRWRSKTGV